MGNMGGKEGRDDSDGDDTSSARSEGDPEFPESSDHVVSIQSAGHPLAPPPPPPPPRSPSPVTFAPQVPLAPMQGAAELPAVLNQIWMNKSGSPPDFPIEKGIPTLITWNYGGNNVAVEGSWDNWTSRKVLQRSGKDHAILLVLPSGIYQYKFIVDGSRRYMPDLPCIADEMGNFSNLLDVHDYIPENIENVSKFESLPSPDSSYSHHLPIDEDFSKEPPIIPPQLGMSNSEEISSMPQHVVLNHLFLERGWASQSLVSLSLTHRFQSKYVTVILYKAVKK